MTLTEAGKITKGDRVLLGSALVTITKTTKTKTPGGAVRVRLWAGKGCCTYSPSTMVERMV